MEQKPLPVPSGFGWRFPRCLEGARQSQAQDQKKESGAENVRQKIKRVARAGIGHRFFIFFVRESVLLRFRLVGRAGDERRNLSRRRKLRRALRWAGHW